MQPQMVCLQYVETRKCGAIEFMFPHAAQPHRSSVFAKIDK
mgnify:CR=1 FL=1